MRLPTPKVIATATAPSRSWRRPERRTGRPVSRPTTIAPLISATAVAPDRHPHDDVCIGCAASPDKRSLFIVRKIQPPFW
jgi:hypothetical protein